MPIGTGDGQYFDSEVNYQLGNLFNSGIVNQPIMIKNSTNNVGSKGPGTYERGNGDDRLIDKHDNIVFDDVAQNSVSGDVGSTKDALKQSQGTSDTQESDLSKFIDLMGTHEGRVRILNKLEEYPMHKIDQLINTLEVPGKVAQGKLDPNSDEGIESAVNLAGLLMGVGTTMPVEGGLGLFGGRIPKGIVSRAESLENAGVSPEDVKFMTGIERGADNKWREEISDRNASFTLPADYEPSENGYTVLLHKIFDHPDFYSVYPEAKNIPVNIVPKEVLKRYSGVEGTQGLFNPFSGIKLLDQADEPKNVLLHELQHWIQAKEGFSYGNSNSLPTSFQDRFKGMLLRKYTKPYLVQVKDLLDGGKVDEARELAQFLIDYANYHLYRATSPEEEAFSVEARANMTPEERRNNLGSDSEMFPREEQIVFPFRK